MSGIVHHIVIQRSITGRTEQIHSLGCILDSSIKRNGNLAVSGSALACCNHNYTICTARTVDSGSGSIFEHVKTFNVLWVNVVKTEVSRHTVNYDERVTVVNRTETADFDCNVVARFVTANDVYTGDFTLNSLTDIVYRNFLDITRTE